MDAVLNLARTLMIPISIQDCIALYKAERLYSSIINVTTLEKEFAESEETMTLFWPKDD